MALPKVVWGGCGPLLDHKAHRVGTGISGGTDHGPSVSMYLQGDTLWINGTKLPPGLTLSDLLEGERTLWEAHAGWVAEGSDPTAGMDAPSRNELVPRRC